MLRNLTFGLFSVLLVLGAGCTQPAPVTPPSTDTAGDFAAPLELSIGETVHFEDGLEATLVEINDSRCPEGVTCIWAGELSPVLRVSGGHLAAETEVRLGTTSKPEDIFDIYTATLIDVRETAATISISKSQ